MHPDSINPLALSLYSIHFSHIPLQSKVRSNWRSSSALPPFTTISYNPGVSSILKTYLTVLAFPSIKSLIHPPPPPANPASLGGTRKGGDVAHTMDR